MYEPPPSAEVTDSTRAPDSNLLGGCLMWSGIGIVAALVLGIFLAELPGAYVCGTYDLTLKVDDQLTSNLVDISYFGASDRDTIDRLATGIEAMLDVIDHQKPSEDTLVEVGFGWRESMLGITWNHTQQFSHLLVRLEYEDGSVSLHCIEVPHRDVTRSVWVTKQSQINGQTGAQGKFHEGDAN